MAAQQAQRHMLGRTGQQIAKNMLGGQLQTHKAPFDVVDFTQGYAYEVKTMSTHSADLKIHISDKSWQRKLQFSAQYDLTTYLIVVVVTTPNTVEVYRSKLRQSMRVNQMEQIA